MPKQVVGDQGDAQSSAFSGEQVLKQGKSIQVERLDEQVVGLSLQEHDTPLCRAMPTDPPRQSQVQSRPVLNPIPLQDLLTQLLRQTPMHQSELGRS